MSPNPHSTPDEMLAAASAGDLKAFSRLCAYVLPELRRAAVAHARTRPQVSHDDAVQDTMVQFVDAFPRTSFATVGRLMAYLRLILDRRLADQARKAHRRSEQPLPGVDPAAPSPETLAETDIQVLLAALPPREEEVVRRLFLDGQTVAQAASEMDIEAGSVRQTLARALAKLRPLLGD